MLLLLTLRAKDDQADASENDADRDNVPQRNVLAENGPSEEDSEQGRQAAHNTGH